MIKFLPVLLVYTVIAESITPEKLSSNQIYESADLNRYIDAQMYYRLRVIRGFDVNGPLDDSYDYNMFVKYRWEFKKLTSYATSLLWELIEAHRTKPFSVEEHFNVTRQLQNINNTLKNAQLLNDK